MRESWQFILIFLAQVQALANQADKEGTGNLKWELCLSNKSIFGENWPLVKIGYLLSYTIAIIFGDPGK